MQMVVRKLCKFATTAAAARTLHATIRKMSSTESSAVSTTFATEKDDLFSLERLGENEFRSTLRQKSYKRPPTSDKDRQHFLPGIKRGKTAFGGHLISDSMVAALHTAKDPSMAIQSYHAHFILAVNADEPVTYKVEHLRDGQTMNFRWVRAYQDDQTVFAAQLSMSSSKAVNDFPSHQSVPLPKVPPPDTLPSAHNIYSKALMRHDLSDGLKAVLTARQSSLSERYEFRYPDPECCLRLNPTEPFRRVWCRAHDTTASDHRWHQIIASMVTDSQMLGAAIQPHIKFGHAFRGFMTSLDHSIIFHDFDFNMNDWVLFDIESTKAVNGRAYTQGKMWTADGRHVMTCTQEGIMRVRFDNQHL